MAKKDNLFEEKLISGINNSKEACCSPRPYDRQIAMRDFIRNVFPLANEKAKKFQYGSTIEEIVNLVDFAPEQYVDKTKIFGNFIRVHVADILR